MTRILALMPSSLELDSPRWTEAMIASKCFAAGGRRYGTPVMRLRSALVIQAVGYGRRNEDATF